MTKREALKLQAGELVVRNGYAPHRAGEAVRVDAVREQGGMVVIEGTRIADGRYQTMWSHEVDRAGSGRATGRPVAPLLHCCCPQRGERNVR